MKLNRLLSCLAIIAVHVCPFSCPVAVPAQTALKISELPAASSLATTDLTLVVTDPGGSAATKKAAVSVLFDLLDGASMTFTGKTISGASNTLTNVAWSSLVSTPTTLAGYGINDAQPLDATLTALSGGGTGANTLSYWTGTDTLGSTTLTSQARNLLDDADTSTMQATLGLVIGTNVQAQNANLQALADGTVNNTYYYGTDGSGSFGYHAFPSSAAPINVQVFTSNGTWTKPSGAVYTDTLAIGGGGGGGSGRRGELGTNLYGGGGGSHGAMVKVDKIPAAFFDGTESVIVGSGGAGGAAVTTDDTSGATGSAGGDSSVNGIVAKGGLGGAGGTGSAAAGGAAVTNANLMGPTVTPQPTVAGGNGGIGASTSPAATNFLLPTSGGGGGGFNTGGSGFTGAAGGGYNASFASTIFTGLLTAAAGGLPSTTGTANPGGTGVSTLFHCGLGGGGGGAVQSEMLGFTSGAGGQGGDGGIYGGGGGGGSASENGHNSGKGGDGGDGIVIMTTILSL